MLIISVPFATLRPTHTRERMGAPRILHRFSNTPHNQPFQPPNMPKYVNFDEDRMAKAFAAAVSQKTPPNSAKIAREFDASYHTLTSRVKNAKSPTTPKDSYRNTLCAYQDKSLIRWIAKMYSWNLPPTVAIAQSWANRTLARSG